MANWKFWQRNKQVQTNSELPTEVQEYYASTQANTRARTIAAGITALIITLLIAYVLFLLGSYVYERVTDDSDQTAVTEVEDNRDEGVAQGEVNAPENTVQGDDLQGSRGEGEESVIDDEQDVAVGSPTEESTDDSEEESSGTSLRGDVEQEVSRAPQTGDSVPNTGAGNVLLIFAATTLVSAFLYHVRQVYATKN